MRGTWGMVCRCVYTNANTKCTISAFVPIWEGDCEYLSRIRLVKSWCFFCAGGQISGTDKTNGNLTTFITTSIYMRGDKTIVRSCQVVDIRSLLNNLYVDYQLTFH